MKHGIKELRRVVIVSVGATAWLACLGSEAVITNDPAADAGALVDSAGAADGADPAEDARTAPPDAAGGGDSDAFAPPPKKRIFVTTAVTDGNFPGLAGADAFCGAAATQANIDGTFIAFLSIPGANAIDRAFGDGPWYSMDRQTLLFTGKTSGPQPISGLGPAAPINQNELGQTFTGADISYWTGTSAGGQVSTSHCDLWTNDTTGAGFAGGTVGRTDRTDSAWTAYQTVTCYSPLHVLCFEK